MRDINSYGLTARRERAHIGSFPTFRRLDMVPSNQVASLFDWAQRHGLALFPIKAFHKQPAGIVASHVRDCSRDSLQWGRWYDGAGGCNFGVACGESGLIVVDVDTDQLGTPRFDARWAAWARENPFGVVSPRGGRHLYCRIPQHLNTGKFRQPRWADGIDIRAGGGYVVAPWCETRRSHDSQVKADGFYRLIADDVAIPYAPLDLLEHCKPYERETLSAPPVDGFDEDGYSCGAGLRIQIEHFLAGPIADIRAAPQSTRNETLNRAGFQIGRVVAGGQFERRAAEILLTTLGMEIGLRPDEVRATTRSCLDGAREQPLALRPSLQALLATSAPIQPRALCWRPTPDPSVLAEPIVERLLLAGEVTVLSGGSGTGKTTVGASLMAASAGGLRNFRLPGLTGSDVLTRPAAWVFISYEGGQYIDRHRRAWHIGTSVAEAHPQRRAILTPRGTLVYADAKRNVVIDSKQRSDILAAIDGVRTANADLPVAVVVDGVTSAVQDATDPAQAAAMMAFAHDLAGEGMAVLLLAHPPKSGHSAVYGSHLFFSLADIVASLEVVKKASGEWTQWIDFDKHRAAPNGRCLELKSRKLDKPIMDLPPEWGDDARARERALDDLRTPYIFQICVKWESEREAAKAGVTKVSEKSAMSYPVVAPDAPFNIVPFKAVKLQ